jgi:hypothetical protein
MIEYYDRAIDTDPSWYNKSIALRMLGKFNQKLQVGLINWDK